MSPAAAKPQFASSRRLTITAATLVALSFGHAVISSPAQARDQAGVSSAVRGDVKRISQGDAVGVAVASGDPIYRYDRITSGSDAGLQVMLLDETTLTIGPNSSITITEFVYDPSTGAGKVAAAIGNGFFRFVSGRVAHHNPTDMTVSLPVATIGVRGTIVFGETTETGAIVGLAGPGGENNTGDKVAGVDVITRDGTAQLRRTGWGAIVIPGVAPVAQPLPLDTISRLLDAVVAPEFEHDVRTSCISILLELFDALRGSSRNRANFLEHRIGNRPRRRLSPALLHGVGDRLDLFEG